MQTQSEPESIPCPEPACPDIATLLDRWTWPSTDGPVEHVKTHCPSGHVFTPTTDSLLPDRSWRPLRAGVLTDNHIGGF